MQGGGAAIPYERSFEQRFERFRRPSPSPRAVPRAVSARCGLSDCGELCGRASSSDGPASGTD